MASTNSPCYDNLIIDQGSAGVCWLASILHAMFYSDGTRPLLRSKMEEIEGRLNNNEEVDILDTTLFNAYNLYNTSRKNKSNVEQQQKICIQLPTVAESIVDIEFENCQSQQRKIGNTRIERNFYVKNMNAKQIVETGTTSHLQLPRLLKWAGLLDKTKIYRFHNVCDHAVIEKILNDNKYCELVVLTFDNNNIQSPASLKINDTIYTLDSCILSSLREKQVISPLLGASEKSKTILIHNMRKTRGHAIAGITCKGKRFVYNSWWSKVPTKTDWYSSAMILSNDRDKISVMSSEKIDTLCDIVQTRFNTNNNYFYHLSSGTSTLIYVKQNEHENSRQVQANVGEENLFNETIIQKPLSGDTCDCDNKNEYVEFMIDVHDGSKFNKYLCKVPVSKVNVQDNKLSINTEVPIKWLGNPEKTNNNLFQYSFNIINNATLVDTKHLKLSVKVNDAIYILYEVGGDTFDINIVNKPNKWFIKTNTELKPFVKVDYPKRGPIGLWVFGNGTSDSLSIYDGEKVYDLNDFDSFVSDGGAVRMKQYIYYNNKKYIVRKTTRNAKYILVNKTKKYLSSIKNNPQTKY